jgi:hypothetical protein
VSPFAMPKPSATTSAQVSNQFSQSPAEASDSDGSVSQQPSRKRARRIALACNVGPGRCGSVVGKEHTDDRKRCKSRKQRCNMEGRGPNDPCKSCEKAGADCVLQEKPPKVRFEVKMTEHRPSIQANTSRSWNPG